ncbi:hypothetical protein M422DRAFT_44474 [Sphaerobolus stellatus SS14]|nr:hypothetical protein M422DRAFT_44474 [Sphaerobolus stellatus SS14]
MVTRHYGQTGLNAAVFLGNFGFKAQWLALEWIGYNISAFGGHSDDICLIGLSTGAHSVHQLLHHVTRLPGLPGIKSSSQRACLQSNDITTNPKTPRESRKQYQVLLRAVELDLSDKLFQENIKDTD